MTEYFKLALLNIRSSLIRSILTMLGIVIGIASVVSVLCIGEGGRLRINEELDKIGGDRIWIYASNNFHRGLTVDDAETLKNIWGVEHVSPVSYRQETLTANSVTVNARITGVSPAMNEIERVYVKYGRYISDNDTTTARRVIVLPSKCASILFGTENAVGEYVRLKGRKFCVVGITQRDELPSAGESVYTCQIPIQTYNSAFSTRKVNEIDIVSDTDILEAQDSIVQALSTRFGRSDAIKAYNMSTEMETAQTIMRTFKLVISCIAAVSLMVGGIGVMNVMLMSVRERTGEIGIRKALGATRRQLVTQFVAEAMSYSVIGGAIGLGLGVGLTVLSAQIIEVPVIIPMWSLALGLGFSVGIGAFFGVYPAIKAAELDPVEALRHN